MPGTSRIADTTELTPASQPVIRLGIRENLFQFSLLVLVNGFVGAMVGMERAILPAIAEDEFQLAARTAILSTGCVFVWDRALHQRDLQSARGNADVELETHRSSCSSSRSIIPQPEEKGAIVLSRGPL